MASCICAFRFSGSTAQKTPFSHKLEDFKLSFSSSVKPLLRNLQQNVPVLRLNDPYKTVEEASLRLLDAFVDQVFEFIDQPLLPSQSNFAPVEERGDPVNVAAATEGRIPDDFPEGVYIRNGTNPLFGGHKSVVSVFGRTTSVWVEGEGMVHAIYFTKDSVGNWTTVYNNKYVETETYLLAKERNRPCFLPSVEGDPAAVIASFLLNNLRFGMPNIIFSNTNVIEHAGKFYSVAENYVPQEIDIKTLKTLGNWDLNEAWTKPFTSHPKRAPGTGELVIMGADGKKPYYMLGVISADGTKLIHKVDMKFERSVISHDIGVTERYNVIMDFPLVIDVNRVIRGGALIKHEKDAYARIGIMPRYGDADSVLWFQVETCSAFHIINCFEDGDEVVVMGCRAEEAILPGPELGKNKFEWFSRGFKHVNLVEENNENTQDGKLFTRAYEWRLNMKTGEVNEGYLTGTEFSMDFPEINTDFTGFRNKYAYTQVIDSTASTTSGMSKYGGLAKLYLDDRNTAESSDQGLIKVEYHMFPENTFCTGAAFVAKSGAAEEDDGWIITYAHNEDTNVSQVYIVDAKQFSSKPVAIIGLPSRVPYGFHGYFASTK